MATRRGALGAHSKGLSGDRVYLFVYGTLRRGFSGPVRQLLANNAVCIGEARFRGRLYDLGRYPGAVGSRHKRDWVVGELYRLRSPKTAFAALDAYEGERFRRHQVVVRSLSGKKIRSWIYLFTGNTAAHRLIPSGDYVAHGKGR
jgi:gamma-glutamylcyclotransferase (GGCT)/AIG2-like uncharacterized protein YtfP